jgi:hypothetical protein
MGPASSINNQNVKELHDRFHVVEEFSDKSISYLEEKDTHKPFVLKEITFNDKEEFSKALSKVAVKQKTLEGQPHVVPLTCKPKLMQNTSQKQRITSAQTFTKFSYCLSIHTKLSIMRYKNGNNVTANSIKKSYGQF